MEQADHQLSLGHGVAAGKGNEPGAKAWKDDVENQRTSGHQHVDFGHVGDNAPDLLVVVVNNTQSFVVLVECKLLKLLDVVCAVLGAQGAQVVTHITCGHLNL